MIKHMILFVTSLMIVSYTMSLRLFEYDVYNPTMRNSVIVKLTEAMDTTYGFDKVIPFVLKHEGNAFVQDTAINEVSRRGITLQTYRQYYRRGNENSIRNITVKEATAIYQSLFWNANNLDSLISIGFKKTAVVLMDSEVNLGSRRANKFFQEVVGMPKRHRTGRIDSTTLSFLRNSFLNDDDIYKRLIKKRRDYYARLVKKRKVFKQYHSGWNNRLDAMLVYAEELK